jgi:hypothetical protein
MFNLVEGAAGLGKLAQLAGVHVKKAGRAGLADGNVDGAQPGAVHAGKGSQVGAPVHQGNVHEHAQLLGFVFGGLDGPGGLFKSKVHGQLGW